MPQGLICHKPFVHHVLCLTIPICHSRELFVHRVLCVTVTFSLLTMTIVSKGLICHKVQYDSCPMLRVRVRVGIPLETSWTLCRQGMGQKGPCDTEESFPRRTEHGAYRHCNTTGMLLVGPYPTKITAVMCILNRTSALSQKKTARISK